MTNSLPYRFFIYQLERFPLFILIFTTTSVVLSTAAIVVPHFSSDLIPLLIVGTTSVLLYLFHIRVVDEVRDSSHDSRFHQDRPVQRGLISLGELRAVNRIGLVVFAAISIYLGWQTALIGAALLTYTHIAGKDFFVADHIRDRFLTYNAVNLVQMLLLQVYLYSVFTARLTFSRLVFAHLLFVFVDNVLLEILRKIKIETEESPGNDTYSARLGFRGSLILFALCALCNHLLFIYLLFNINVPMGKYMFFPMLFISFLLLSTGYHYFRHTKSSEGLLYLSTLIRYVGLNSIIFLAWL